jgi:alpha-tubulin suppressor-like RCC1 family protein
MACKLAAAIVAFALLVLLAPPTVRADFLQADLTNTNQILPGPRAVGANFIYPGAQSGVAAPGTVSSILFTDISWVGGTQALGGGVTVTPVMPDPSLFEDWGERNRFQDTSTTISGPDAAILQSIADTINYIGIGETEHLVFAGLGANQLVQVQLIGGDNGAFLGNWLGYFDITANAVPIGTWFAANDGDNTLATLATFTATTDAAGILDIALIEANNTPTGGEFEGAFAGIAGATISLVVPEPASVLLISIGAASILFLFARRRSRETDHIVTPIVVYLATAIFLGASQFVHAGTLRTVALSGQQVPGAPDGTVFTGFDGRPPVLNDAGQTAFVGGSTAAYGIWSEGAGSLSMVAARGQQAPGMPDGVNFYDFYSGSSDYRVVISDTGLTAFTAYVREPGSVSSINGIWSSGPGGSALVARTGEQAAGMPAGVFYNLNDSISLRTFLVNDAGQVAFQTILWGPGGYGIFAQRHGNLELVARTGNHAPGTPHGVDFSSFGGIQQFSLNKTGQTAFWGGLIGSGVDATNDEGVWSEGSGSLALVAREGSQAPGMPDGAVFGIVVNASNKLFLARPALNNAGQTAFASHVTGGGVDATNNGGIWLGTAGNLSLVIRSGDHAPGTPSGVNLSSSLSTSQPVLNDAGQIAFTATLTGAGVDFTNNLGLWAGVPGSLALVARTGDHAPSTEDGVVFGSLNNPQSAGVDRILNAAGQTAFVAQLTGSGISAGNDIGIWATDRSGALQLIAREGDALEVEPGDFRRVSLLTFLVRDFIYPTGNSDGRPSAFNNRGQLAFLAQFTDGSSGIFVSNAVAIPEPSTFILAAAALGLCIARRRTRDDNRNAARVTRNIKRRGFALFGSIVTHWLCACAASAAPAYNIVPLGFDDLEHTKSDGFKYSSASQLNEAGQVSGLSYRYNGGGTDLGRSAWLYDGATPIKIGLVDGEHTRSDGYKYSAGSALNEAGQVSGISQRFHGGIAQLQGLYTTASSAWLYDGTTTIDIGLTGPEHTRSDGYKYSGPSRMNQAGQVLGSSFRYNGGNSQLGNSIWLYDGTTTIDVGLTGPEHTYLTGYKESVAGLLNEAGQVSGYSRRFNGSDGRSAWLYNGTTTIDIGLTGPEHTSNFGNGNKYSSTIDLNESGQVTGYSSRYNGGGTYLGSSTWLYNGTTTIDIGRTGPEYTRNDGYKYSYAGRLNEAGQVLGYSTRYNGGSTALGNSAWLYDGTTTIDIGLTGPEHTRNDGYQSSQPFRLNESGQVVGQSNRYNGGSTQLGQSIWLYNGATTIDIGLVGSEHTRGDGYKYSSLRQFNEAGHITGYSERYDGGSFFRGRSAWLYDGATTIDIGLSGSEHTRSDGYKYSWSEDLNEAGQVIGYSERYTGGGTPFNQDAWVYDPLLGQTFALSLSTRSDGYAHSDATYLGEDGLVLGTYQLFDGLDNDLGRRAFYFTVADGLHDLGSLVDSGLTTNGWDYLASAIRANGVGQVIGYGKLTSQSGNVMGYLLKPVVPEPSALILVTVALGLCLVHRRGVRSLTTSLPKSVRSSLAHQCLKTGLLKVMVPGQRLGDAALLHQQERDAIRQRPILVGALLVAVQRLLKLRACRWNHLDKRFRLESANETRGTNPQIHGRQRIGKFDQHPGRSHQSADASPTPLHRRDMILVSGIDQRQEVVRVDKLNNHSTLLPVRVMIVPLRQIRRTLDGARIRQIQESRPVHDFGRLRRRRLNADPERSIHRNLDRFIGSDHPPIKVAVELDHVCTPNRSHASRPSIARSVEKAAPIVCERPGSSRFVIRYCRRSHVKSLVYILSLIGSLLISAAARADSAVAWGGNSYGALGDGTTTGRLTTMPVIGMDSGVTAVAGGEYYSLAVKDGGAYAWGRNTYGQLGDGTTTTRLTPVPVSGLASGVTAVGASEGFGSHSLAVQNGAVFAWGSNPWGQLGDGTTTRRLTPVAVIGMDSGATAVAAGRDHSLAVKDGGFYAWGDNAWGQLGDDTTTRRLAPVAVIGMDSGITAIDGGVAHSLAVKDGGVYSWGANNFGQLGHGSSDILKHPMPELVAGLESGATAVAATEFSLAVVNASVYAWGYTIGGTPVQIDPTNLTDIVAVAAGYQTGYALSSDGRLWSWNIHSSRPYTPQRVLPPDGYKFTSIAAGGAHVVATLAAVPEPSTLLLAAAAFAGLLPRRAAGSRERRTLIVANQHSSGLRRPLAVARLAEMSVD